VRRQKKRSAPGVDKRYQVFETGIRIWSETWMPVQPASIWNSNIGGLPVHGAKQ